MTDRFRSMLFRFVRLVTHPVVVLTITFFAIFPFVYLGRYNHPSSDDYGNARWSNFFHTQAVLFQNWTGRYFSSMVVTLVPLHWHSFTAYRIAAEVLILVFSVVFFCLVERLLVALTFASRRLRFIIASATLLLMLNNLSSISEAFYWYCGAMTYTLSAIFFALFLLITIRLHVREKPPGSGQYIVASLLLIATIGCNETILVLANLVCAGLVIYYKGQGQAKLSRFYSILLIVCVLASVIVVLAPGNSVRQLTLVRNLFTAMLSWLYFTQKLCLTWILDPFLMLFTALLIVVGYSTEFKTKMPSLLLSLLFSILLIFLLTFPGFWSMGRMPPGRSRNVIYLFFVVSWIFFGLNLGKCLRNAMPVKIQHKQVFQQLGLIVLFFCLMTGINENRIKTANFFYLAKNFVEHTPQRYDEELHRRYAIIANTQSDTVVVPQIRLRGGNLLYFDDIGRDPKRFPNPAFAFYWGKSAIYLIPDTMMTK